MSAAEPRFFLTARDGRDFALVDGVQVVGRSASADVQLPSDQVSRRHAKLTVTEEILTMEDLGSLNGTFVNGERLQRPQVLLPGDRVGFGEIELLVRGALRDQEHEIRTPVTSGYSRLPQLHMPSVIITELGDDEPTAPVKDDVAPPAVLVALSNAALARQLVQTAAARKEPVPYRAVAVDEVYEALGAASGGALVLDVEAFGPAVPDLVRAWRGPSARRDPVVLLGSLSEEDGMELAARSGADAYVASGASAKEVVRAILVALVGARRPTA